MQGEGLPDVAGPTALLLRSADGSLLKPQPVPPFNNAELPGMHLSVIFAQQLIAADMFAMHIDAYMSDLVLHCSPAAIYGSKLCEVDTLNGMFSTAIYQVLHASNIQQGTISTENS